MTSKFTGNICHVGNALSLRNAVVAFSLAIVSAAGLTLSCSAAHAQGQNGLANKIWVRMVVFGQNDEPWNTPNEKGRDIINMVQTLKPDVITRFMSGDPDTSITVPMGHGESSMSLVNYISAVQAAGAYGAFITPKINLGDSFSYQIQAANDLFALPVTPRLKAVDLDTYYDSGNTQAADNAQTQAIKNAGFKWIGWNFAGGDKETDGIGDYAYAGIDSTTWTVNQPALNHMSDDGIPTHLAHIDYPSPILAFMQLTPDQQADAILTQHQYGFTLVYPVLYSTQGYDASKIVTSANRRYHGLSILQIIAADIQCDRQYPINCSVP